MIHRYKAGGYCIVLDVESGSIHVMDEAAYEAAGLMANKPELSVGELMAALPYISRNEAEETLAELGALRRAGTLFSTRPPEYEAAAAEYRRVRREIKALCLHVAHTCNLTCDYCFAKGGQYNGGRALMSVETGKQAMDFLVAHSGSRRNLEVDFFGGEPLMNLDTVRELVSYARALEGNAGKRFRFTFTTNGLLLDDDSSDFLNREMDTVVLSLDGRPEIHDRLRRTVNGKGSYALVVPKFRRLVEKRRGRNYYMRGTYTAANPDFAADVIHMADLGFDRLSMEPVVCPADSPHALTDAHMPLLKAQYDRLAEEITRRRRQGRPITFYHYILDLSHGPCIYKRITGCGAGTEYLAVTPDGTLFPCHQFVGDPRFSMGNVCDGVVSEPLRSHFAAGDLFAKPECGNCWARLYCAGGCAANAYRATGDIHGVYSFGCELFRKRIECAILLQVQQNDEEESC